MPISVVCSQCGKTLRAPDEMAGKRARCPNCKNLVHISVTQPEPKLDPVDDATYGLSQEVPPLRPTYTPPRPVARSAEEAYEQAINRTFQLNETPGGTTTRSASRRRKKESDLPKNIGERKSPKLAYLFALTLVPLVFSLLGSAEDVSERIERTLANHPEVAARVDAAQSRDDFLGALPDGRVDGAHLSSGSWVHWLYALIAAGLFYGLIVLLFERAEARTLELLAVGAVTATVGIFLLLAFQFVAGWTQGFWLRGRGIIVLLFYIVKFIGFSYQAALNPENGFLLSFLGFTCGVGLCEEFIKALPLYIKVRNGDDLSWRAACVWGLASGVGFGIAEGIMYSSDHYNGIATFGIYPVRFISCVGLHAIWTASVALMLWHNQDLAGGELDWGDWFLGLLKVQGIPMLLHGLYDTLLKRDMNALALLAAVASFGWLAFLLARSRQSDPEPEPPSPHLVASTASR